MAVSDDTAEFIQTARNNTLAVSPLVGLSARDVGAAAGALVDAVIRTPRVARRHLGNLGREVSAVLRGESTLAPDPKDRRFADPAWQGNLMLKGLLQTYLATQRELDNFIDAADTSPVKQGRARFLSTIVVDALAPSNWPLANPAALRKALDTGGANYTQGLRNLTADIRYNHGLQQRSGKEVDAPIQTGSAKHPPLCPAPGTYVLEK